MEKLWLGSAKIPGCAESGDDWEEQVVLRVTPAGCGTCVHLGLSAAPLAFPVSHLDTAGMRHVGAHFGIPVQMK